MSLPMPQSLANMPSQEGFGPLNSFMNQLWWTPANASDAMQGLSPPNGQDVGWGPLLPPVFGGDNDPINPPPPPWEGPVQMPPWQGPINQRPWNPQPWAGPPQRPPQRPQQGQRPPGSGFVPPAPQGFTVPGAGVIPQLPPGFPGSGSGGFGGGVPFGSSGGGLPGMGGSGLNGGGNAGGGNMPPSNNGSSGNIPGGRPQQGPSQRPVSQRPAGYNASINGVPQLGSVAYLGNNPYPDTPAYAALRYQWNLRNSPGGQPGFQRGNSPGAAYQPPAQPTNQPVAQPGTPAPGQLGAIQRFAPTMATPNSSQPNFVSNATGATRRQFTTLPRA